MKERKRWMTGRRGGGARRSGLRRGSGDRKQRGGREEVERPAEPEHSGWDNTHKHVYLKDNMSPAVFLSHRQWGRDCSVNMLQQLGNLRYGCFLGKPLVLVQKPALNLKKMYIKVDKEEQTAASLKFDSDWRVVEQLVRHQITAGRQQSNSRFTGWGLDCFLRGIFASFRPRSCSGCGGSSPSVRPSASQAAG